MGALVLWQLGIGDLGLGFLDYRSTKQWLTLVTGSSISGLRLYLGFQDFVVRTS